MIALLRKELREHVWVFLGWTVFYAFSLFALAVNPLYNGGNASAFYGLRAFLLVIFPFLVVVVTSRLVAREYTGRTQLFLETLPVSRATVLTAKLLLGFVLSLAVVAIALWLFARLTARHELLDRRALGFVALRSFGYAVCVYAFFFAGGLLGRYRVAIILFLFVGLVIVNDTSTFRFEEFGPIRLVGPDFPYERTRFPTRALWVSLALTVGFIALAYVLALVREGTVSALLAQRMSQREKVAIACVLLGMIFLKSFYDEARGPRAYDLSDAKQAESRHLVVKVGLGYGVTAERAEQLAGRVVTGMDGLSAELGLEQLPEIFILPSRELEPDVYERGVLKNARGVVTRGNITDSHFSDDNFVSWIAREVVDTATRGRATEERRNWLLDGFSTDWSVRQSAEAAYVPRCGGCHPADAREKYLREGWPEIVTGLSWQRSIPEHEQVIDSIRTQLTRAAYAFAGGITPEMLRDWATTRERYGDCFTSAAAWMGVQVLRKKLDPPALHRFLHEALARTPSSGLRALSVRESPESELLRTTGLRMEEVLGAWNVRLSEAAQHFEPTLEKIPRVTAALDLVPVSATGREARYRVTLDPEPQGSLRLTFVTSKLDPFDRTLEWKDLTLDERTYPDLRTGVLPRAFSRGERLAWAVETRLDALDCRVTTGIRRVEVR